MAPCRPIHSLIGRLMAKLVSVLLAIILAGVVIPAPAYAEYIHPDVAEAHNLLVDALVRRGISLYVDSPACQSSPGLEGYYSGSQRALVLCNDGSLRMTEDNLNTLRHEATHFIQDCADGAIDNTLRTVLKQGQARELLSTAGLDADLIREVYSVMGQANHVPLEEEAFAVAATMNPGTIVAAMNIFCPLP